MRLPTPDHDPIRSQLEVRRALAASQAIVLPGALHRIAEVRSRQGVSLRAARQALHVTSEEVHMQENETSICA